MPFNIKTKKILSEENCKRIIQLGISLRDQLENTEKGLISDYDNTKTYTRGQAVYYNNYLYKCLYTTTGTWDSTKWQKIGDELDLITKADIEAMLGLNQEEIETLQKIINDSQITLSTTHSSSKIFSDMQDILSQSKTFTLQEFAKASKASYQVVSATSQMLDKSVIYLMPNSTNYDMYIVESDGTPVKIGDTTIDLSQFYTKTEIDNNFVKKTDADGKYATITTVDGKVDKTSILSTISSTPSDDKLLSEKAVNDTFAKKLNLTGGTMTGVLTINNNNPAINLSLQGQSTDKVAEDIRFVDRNGLTRSCVRGNFSALELGQRTTKDGSKWYDGSALLLNDNGSFNLRASDSNGGNRKSLIGTSTDLKWDGNKVITEDQLYRYIPYFPKTIQFGHDVKTLSDTKWVKIFEFTPNRYDWNGGNFIITFSSLNIINSYYSFCEYELIWKCTSKSYDSINDVYLNQIISQNDDVCHTIRSALCVGISENKKTVGLYAFLGRSTYQTMLATIISGGSRYENRQSEIAKWVNIDTPTKGLTAQPTFSKANYYSLADNLGGWTYTATKLPVLNYTNVE